MALDHVARRWQLRLGNRLGGSRTALDHEVRSWQLRLGNRFRGSRTSPDHEARPLEPRFGDSRAAAIHEDRRSVGK